MGKRVNSTLLQAGRGRPAVLGAAAPPLLAIAPLSAGQAYVCWGTRECVRAGALDGPVCPRGAHHNVRVVHYLDLTAPAEQNEAVAA